jgi:class 3 adenylate cyclase/ActR/RegA family two-component response regulator
VSDPYSKIRHDLRTPVNQIIGYSELLQEIAEEEGNPQYVSDLKKIRAAADRMLELINEFFGGKKAAPAEEVQAPPLAPAADTYVPTAPAASPDQEHGRLLVVDDNEMNRDMLSRRLAAKGHAVGVAEDGERALAMIGEDRPDLVLLDVMMPGISGLEVLQRLREKFSASDLPIIMATAMDASKDIVEALRLGANDYVTKPLDFPVVLARVQGQLALKRAKDEIQKLAQDLELHNRFIRHTFGRYLSKEVVSSLLESPEGLKLGGESRRVTILMSDLRGFTSVSERLGPEQVVRLLNTYLGAMATIILKHQGTIDEFIGDAVLAIFGAPISREDDARRAVACACDMQLAMEAVNRQNQEEGLPSVEMGIAVHTGPVVVGNIGSQERTKYGVVGPTVNLTGRIESYTIGGQVLISEETRKEVADVVSVAGRQEIQAKGSKDPVVVWNLRGIDGDYDLHLGDRREELVGLEPEVTVRYALLEGKHVRGDSHLGRLVRLSRRGGEIRFQTALSALSNVKIWLTGDDGKELAGDLYAKVMAEPSGEAAASPVYFTSMTPEVEAYLHRCLDAAASRQVT